MDYIPDSFLDGKPDASLFAVIGKRIVGIANHHIVPGKKFWTWGSGLHGQVWDKLLTAGDMFEDGAVLFYNIDDVKFLKALLNCEGDLASLKPLLGPAQESALVVAAVALVAALAGTAVGGVAVTALNKKEKKQVNRIAKKQGKKQAQGLLLVGDPSGYVTFVIASVVISISFAPILLLQGNVGEFVGTIATSVIVAIAVSLTLALTVIAALAGLLPLAYGLGGADPYMGPMALALGWVGYDLLCKSKLGDNERVFAVDPSAIRFGPGALAEIGHDARELGLKAGIACSAVKRRADASRGLARAAGVRCLRRLHADPARYPSPRRTGPSTIYRYGLCKPGPSSGPWHRRPLLR